jgi:hypothetical protein
MIHGLVTSHEASAVIAPFLIVAFSDAAASSKVAPATGPTAPLVGTVGKVGVSAVGQMADVERTGIPRVRLGGPVDAGDRLTSDANGKAVKVTAAGQRVIGTAEQPGVADDIINYFAAPSVAQGA